MSLREATLDAVFTSALGGTLVYTTPSRSTLTQVNFMSYARRVDSNQVEVVEYLRKRGYSVVTGMNDIMVGRNGVSLWVELKSKDGTLTPAQKELVENYQGAYLVAYNPQEIENWFQFGQNTHPALSA